MSVMLVDDDDIANFLNKRIAEHSGYFKQVHVFSSSPNALKYLQNCHSNGMTFPRFILLDLMMPVMDGFTFLEACHSCFSNIESPPKVIMLTSSLNIDDKEKAKQFPQVVAYLNKPLEREVFHSLMQQLIR